MKGHELLERDGPRYCYRLTDKGKRVAAMFVFFHQRICGPLAHSLFDHRPEKTAKPPARIEAPITGPMPPSRSSSISSRRRRAAPAPVPSPRISSG
jgi:hypothetical protein